MAWKDVCVRGHPVGGRVREDDPKGSDAAAHDAGGPSPGIEKFILEVVRMTPGVNTPAKPLDFPPNVFVDTYPGRGGVDVHFEGRGADVSFSVLIPDEKVWGDWLFDWCVANCTIHKVQEAIFGTRCWFAEMNGGREDVYRKGDHNTHVHVALNCDGAALSTSPPAAAPAGLAGTWDVTIGTWTGVFIFDANRNVSWANDPASRRTPGDWRVDGGSLYFQFRDPGDFRVFEAPLPVNTAGTSGKILPKGQGVFQMSKRP